MLTKGSSTVGDENFWPLSGWLPAANVASVRGTIEMRASTGDCQVLPAYETANDTDSPNTPAFPIGSAYRTTDGVTYPTSWTDVVTDVQSAQWIRFGVLAKNITGSAITGCQARIKIDILGPART